MPIIVDLDIMVAKRKIRSKEPAERNGITDVNVSLLKSGRVKGGKRMAKAALTRGKSSESEQNPDFDSHAALGSLVVADGIAGLYIRLFLLLERPRTGLM